MAHLFFAVPRVKQEVESKPSKEVPEAVVDAEVVVVVVEAADEEVSSEEDNGDADGEGTSEQPVRSCAGEQELAYHDTQCN